MEHLRNKITLGLGLIGIGRPWGHVASDVPSAHEVQAFLQESYALGIRYYDCAASYGTSEERLGIFLSSLTAEQRKNIVIATKFGDHWDKESQTAYVDHTFEALKKSLDNSIDHLKHIDLLYLHKADLASLHNPDVAKAFAYAQSLGIKQFGASVSDVESAKVVCASDFYSVLQFPYNQDNTVFGPIIDLAKKKNKIIVINRPFNMGSMLYSHQKTNAFISKLAAYKAILKKDFHGIILTGTKSTEHLEENIRAFNGAKMIVNK